MYDIETFGVFRLIKDQPAVIDRKSLAAAFIQTLVLIIWIIFFGIIGYDVDSTCTESIHEYVQITFWVFLVIFLVKFISIVVPLALISQLKDKGALMVGIPLNFIVIIGTVEIYITSIYYLAKGYPPNGCESSWYLLLVWIIISFLDMIFLFIVPIMRLFMYWGVEPDNKEYDQEVKKQVMHEEEEIRLTHSSNNDD